MNDFRTAWRISGLLAFFFSGLLYAVIVMFLLFQTHIDSKESSSSFPTLNLRFAQIELRAAITPPEAIPPESIPLPPDELITEPLQEISPVIRPKKTWPKPKKSEPTEPVVEEAKITQEAATPEILPAVAPDILRAWVLEEIEKQKYYPPSAQRAGYEGCFRLSVNIGANGKIQSACVLDGKGHPLLRRSTKKMMQNLLGRDFGQPLSSSVELPFELEFRIER